MIHLKPDLLPSRVNHVQQRTRPVRRAALYALPLFLLLLFLYGIFALAKPDLSFLSTHYWKQFSLHTPSVSWPWGARAIFRTHTVTSGVAETTEEMQTRAGRQRVNLLNVDLANPNVRLGVVQQHDRLFGPGEPLSSMAARTGAVGGINGDFFEIYGSGDALGMLEINGQIWQSPGRSATLGITSSGHITIGTETFSGGVTAGGASYPLSAVNRYGGASANRLTLFTPVLGTSLPLHEATLALLKPVDGSSTSFTVVSVQTGATLLPRLQSQDALTGSGDAGTWLVDHLQSGDTVEISEHIAPDTNLIQALGGGALLIKDGAIFQDQHAPASSEAGTRTPLTAIGITRDGTRALLVVCDGQQYGQGSSKGFTHTQMAAYLLAHGAYQAMLFDSGGSSEMVDRLPGQHRVSVSNAPSDGHERPVANGLFLYSTEAHPGPATSVVINDGKPLALFTGTTTPISAYALDALANPAANPVQIFAAPANLARISNSSITATFQTGQGQLEARAGPHRAAISLQVVDHLAALHLAPTLPSLNNGQRVQFQAAGSTSGGAPVLVPASAIHWSVNPPSLGSISPSGLFSASPSAVEVGNITATLGGASASASVAVGQVTQPFGTLTNLHLWGVSDHYLNVSPRNVPVPGPHTVSTGSILANRQFKRRPTDAGTLQLLYHFPQGERVYHLDPYPNSPNAFQLPLRKGKQYPEALGIWVKNTSSSGRGPLALNIGLYEGDNTPVAFHLGMLAAGGWRFFMARIPQGLTYPLKLNYISLLSIDPAHDEKGSVYISDLQAMYAPRPAIACLLHT